MRLSALAFVLLPLSVALVSGCSKKEDSTDTTSSNAAHVAAPGVAPSVQAQIDAQQKAESADRAAHAPKPKP